MQTIFQSHFNNIITFINVIPQKINSAAIDASNAIASKISEYADKLESSNSNAEPDETMMLNKKHIDYIDLLRRKHKEVYNSLLEFYNSLLQQGKTKEEEQVLMLQFLESKLMTLKVK